MSTNGGTTWTNISGATAASYAVKAAATMTGYEYRAVFTCPSAPRSTAATLTVSVATLVTFNPVSKTVAAGLSAAFTASASGTPAPTVQWQSSTNGTAWTNIAGANATTYTVTAASAVTGTQYRAVFTNSAGTAATTAATLTINTPPVVTTNPVSQIVTSGTAITFTAAATARPARSGSRAPTAAATSINITGRARRQVTPSRQPRRCPATSTGVLLRQRVQLGADDRRHADRRHSHHHHVQSAKHLGGSKYVGDLHYLGHRHARADRAVAAQHRQRRDLDQYLRRDDDELQRDGDNRNVGLQVPRVLHQPIWHGGDLARHADHLGGPAITANPTNQSVVAGATVNFTAAATNATSSQWQSSTNGGSTWTNITGATAATYSVTAAATMSGYQYRVLFTNAAGSATTSAATLTVGTPITITSNPQSTSAAANASVTFTTSAIGSPAPTVQWQLSTDNAASWTNITGATTTSYSVTVTSAMAGYKYRVLHQPVWHGGDLARHADHLRRGDLRGCS